MKITVIGGGPGGMYFAILTKKRIPHAEITIFEQNKPDDAFGFGVVFSDETLSEFLSYDQRSYELIRDSFAYWDNLDVARDGQVVRIKGNGFCGCSRKTLLQLLQQRCREEGVNLQFDTRIEDLTPYEDSDLILFADGINSAWRGKFEKEFGTEIEMRKNRFIWCGSSRPLDAFTYFFRNTPYGAFCAHTYQYEEGRSTWIFECSQETYDKAGFVEQDEAGSIAKLEELFKEELDGHSLIGNRSWWRSFPRVYNANWHFGNKTLIGDAKTSAHYSIGSGTKLAMDCAIGLSDAVVTHQDDMQAALADYVRRRRTPVDMIQHAADVSLMWFEDIDRHMQLDFDTFSFAVMSRSKKITIENQARRDADYARRIVQNFNTQHGFADLDTPPAFTPYQLGKLTLPNRIVMSSMGQYQSKDGLPAEWDYVHYTSRAVGGVGLITTGMTAVSATGRITPACNGLYTDEQAAAWQRITDFVHQHTSSKIAVQLGHSGRKGSCQPTNLGKQLTEGGWELISADAIPYKPDFPTPKAMTAAAMDEVEQQFVAAAQRAKTAGFDAIELQMHNGFLLASFLSPLTNKRSDEFGGSVENRAKYPLRVVDAMLGAMGEMPLIVKLSVTDWHPDGVTKADMEYVAQQLKARGVAMLHVVTGNTVIDQKPFMGRMWQTPHAEWIRNTVGIPTITSGRIDTIDQVNTLLLNARADLVALGRPLLSNPYFVLHAKAYEQYRADDLRQADVPLPYLAGVQTEYSKAKKDREEFEKMKKDLKPVSHQVKA